MSWLAVFAAANQRLEGEKDFHTGSLVLVCRECDVARVGWVKEELCCPSFKEECDQRELKAEFQKTHEQGQASNLLVPSLSPLPQHPHPTKAPQPWGSCVAFSPRTQCRAGCGFFLLTYFLII